jgi:hypothetical protein
LSHRRFGLRAIPLLVGDNVSSDPENVLHPQIAQCQSSGERSILRCRDRRWGLSGFTPSRLKAQCKKQETQRSNVHDRRLE